MKTVFKYMSILVIVVGVIGFGFNMIFAPSGVVSFIKQQESITGLTYYTYDFKEYVENIRLSITETTPLMLRLPQGQWVNIDMSNWPIALGIDISIMVDYIIMILNIILYPLRTGAYLLRTILAVIGIKVINADTTTNYYWIIDLIDTLLPMQIPYING